MFRFTDYVNLLRNIEKKQRRGKMTLPLHFLLQYSVIFCLYPSKVSMRLTFYFTLLHSTKQVVITSVL